MGFESKGNYREQRSSAFNNSNTDVSIMLTQVDIHVEMAADIHHDHANPCDLFDPVVL